ncbi:hypothetical protein SAMN05720468_11248 [Fibrobacter sp. UWEL]|nr:hypothetical protein SAMN05720468_11248 [Fibrobacter sp. UWEL]
MSKVLILVGNPCNSRHLSLCLPNLFDAITTQYEMALKFFNIDRT